MLKRHIHLFLAVLMLVIPFLGGCDETDVGPLPIQSADAWPEADQLFRKNPRWLGADDAYSVNLGGGRILWLFGDSFIAPPEGGGRDTATMVRNSIAIQNGTDPTSADIQFFWNHKDGAPVSYFATEDEAKDWYWPGNGVRVGNRILLFMMKIRSDGAGFFEIFGWQAVLVDDPCKPVPDWKLSWPESPGNDYGVTIGCAGVMRRGPYIYAFSVESVENHPVYLVRWPVQDIARGDLAHLSWWTGENDGWVPQEALKEKPAPLFTGGQMEFSVHYDTAQGQYLLFQTRDFWDPSIAVRRAEELTGPWSAPENVYTPPAAGTGLLVYAGKAHPEMTGADLVLTYVVNTFDEDQLFSDNTIYYPRFVKAAWGEREAQE